MESQNHYYGHSGAFARYLGLGRPRHVAGLVQHGWTATSPVRTHFRDFPDVGRPGGRRGRRLLVWSHASRAWDPSREVRATVPIGAPWLYLCKTEEVGGTGTGQAGTGQAGTDQAGTDQAGTGTSATGTSGRGTVILPVHGIATQPLHGDHARTAREWARTEGPSTVCLYHLEADDPRVVGAYRDAGHRCVTLGTRTDAAFLTRLYALLSGAGRVVSNRLSTPVLYAAALGRDVAVHGDAMLLDGEQASAAGLVAGTWPEFYEAGAGAEARRALALAELGASWVREPAELSALLGWDRTVRVGPWVDHWVRSPAGRAVTSVRRVAGARGADGGRPTAATLEADSAVPGLSAAAWLRGALSYLPHRLGPVIDPAEVAPLEVG